MRANTNKIGVLENGKVAEAGSPGNLKKQKGVFFKMVEKQMNGTNVNLNHK